VLGRWPIRVKFRVGLGLLLLLVAILSAGSLYSTYTYRSLAKDLSWRAEEIPLSGDLNRRVVDLRIALSEHRGLRESSRFFENVGGLSSSERIRGRFSEGLRDVEIALGDYRSQLEHEVRAGSPISDNDEEWGTVRQIEASLARIQDIVGCDDWVSDGDGFSRVEGELERLQTLSAGLPRHLWCKMSGLAAEVRSQYRVLIYGTWITTISAGLVLALFLKLFFQWVVHPLGVLIAGSRLVAAGQFSHRIGLETSDEMAELARAMNDMTARFQAIRDDLDRQVQERTKQVVRSEKLASVGFLAAGVAHEINNPLASIAMCAESLEGRFAEAIDPTHPDFAVFAEYLRMIQSEAFRCKEITEKLLDFSRMGEAKRQPTDLGDLVRGVIEMVGHVGKYRHKQIHLVVDEAVAAPVNPQEIKQVVLNLLTNALDSVATEGWVGVEVRRRGNAAEITVADDGCGMTADVMEHIFEPFFTRRREGQGTGLGLSISYRIVSDHGGQLEARSDGPDRGATFCVRLPLTAIQKETNHRHLAA
jgi:signal transduction histidine kinase